MKCDWIAMAEVGEEHIGGRSQWPTKQVGRKFLIKLKFKINRQGFVGVTNGDGVRGHQLPQKWKLKQLFALFS